MPGSDYINANYIKQEEDGIARPQGFKQYIATQVSERHGKYSGAHIVQQPRLVYIAA